MCSFCKTKGKQGQSISLSHQMVVELAEQKVTETCHQLLEANPDLVQISDEAIDRFVGEISASDENTAQLQRVIDHQLVGLPLRLSTLQDEVEVCCWRALLSFGSAWSADLKKYNAAAKSINELMSFGVMATYISSPSSMPFSAANIMKMTARDIAGHFAIPVTETTSPRVGIEMTSPGAMLEFAKLIYSVLLDTAKELSVEGQDSLSSLVMQIATEAHGDAHVFIESLASKISAYRDANIFGKALKLVYALEKQFGYRDARFKFDNTEFSKLTASSDLITIAVLENLNILKFQSPIDEKNVEVVRAASVLACDRIKHVIVQKMNIQISGLQVEDYLKSLPLVDSLNVSALKKSRMY